MSAVISYDHLVRRRAGAPRKRGYTIVETGRRKFHPENVHPNFEALRARRVELNLSQQELSGHLGVDVTTLCRWECGAMVPSALKFFDWCAVLSVRLEVVVAS